MKFSFMILFLIFNALISDCFAQKIHIIKVGERSIEVASHDLPDFSDQVNIGAKLITWEQAMTMCEEKGNGWRLPTLPELRAIYMQLSETYIDHFEGWYWSGTKYNDNDAWGFHFEYGIANNQYYDFKRSKKLGRAVRDLP